VRGGSGGGEMGGEAVDGGGEIACGRRRAMGGGKALSLKGKEKRLELDWYIGEGPERRGFVCCSDCENGGVHHEQSGGEDVIIRVVE
jgi:hypothetical protein